MNDLSRGARPHRDDSAATALLKEVLRSQADMAGAMRGARRWWGPDQVPATTAAAPGKAEESNGKGKRRPNSTGALLPLDETQIRSVLERTEESPRLAELAEGTELSPILQLAGRRIGETFAQLRVSEETLTSGPPGYNTEAASGIRIQSRPEEASGVARSRVEEAAARAIHEHAKFHQLDKVDDVIGNSAGYDALRRSFPNRFKHHPNCILLTDDILQRKHELRSAMWKNPARPPDEDMLTSEIAGTRLSLSPVETFKRERAKRVQMAEPLQREPSNLGASLRRERSAPTLHKERSHTT